MTTRSATFLFRAPWLLAVVSIAFLGLAGVAFGGPKELGAYVKGEWKPMVVPQVSITLFRWGSSDAKGGGLAVGEDRMLGQVASRGQQNIEIVMRTPPRKPGYTYKATSDDSPSYEVRLRCGVQILGEGTVVPCGQCTFSRKYNGTSLVSRGAYTSNICCFNATFNRVQGVDILHIVDVIADGESVPYMVKFNIKPTIMRSGTTVPIPPASRLHDAEVSFHELDDNANMKQDQPDQTDQKNPTKQTAVEDDSAPAFMTNIDGAVLPPPNSAPITGAANVGGAGATPK